MLQVKSKYKVCKRLGSSVFEQCQTQKFTLSEARSRKIRRRPRSLSDYGKQLLEKQKVRFTYGLSEKQFSNYVHDAARTSDPTSRLFGLLESRIDSVVFRLGLAPTRRAARQMVSHGHLVINEKKTNVPSYMVSKGDRIVVRDGSRDSVLFSDATLGEGSVPVPNWLSFDKKNLSAQVTGVPTPGPADSALNLAAVFEFYSR